MNTEQNVQIVRDFFAAVGSNDIQSLQALIAEDIEWVIPGQENLPLAGTHRGHARLVTLIQKAAELEISTPEPSEFVAQGDRVLMIGFAKRKVKATNKAFEDHFVLAITVRNRKVAAIREYVDTWRWHAPRPRQLN